MDINAHRRSYLFTGLMLGLLFVITLLLVWRFYSNIQAFQNHQADLAEKQAQVSSQSIESLVASLRNRMQAVALDEFFLFDLKQFQEEEEVQDALHNRLKNYFPEMLAFSLANPGGDIIGGDIHFSVSESCAADIEETARHLNQKTSGFLIQPIIHPSPGNFHFDIMFPVYLNKKPLVYFMSFHADMLHKALLQHKVTDFPVYLTARDQKDLIEASYEGVRDQLGLNIRLTDEQRQNEIARVPVPNTLWEVAVIEDSAFSQAFKTRQYSNFATLYFAILVLWGVIFWGIIRSEKRRVGYLDELSYLSNHDDLTGAINRRKLEERLEKALKKQAETGEYFCILYLDLNKFKPVNDEYGHHVGDEVLMTVTRRLMSCSKQKDLVARIGGDEFVMMLCDMGTNIQEAYKTSSKIAARCHQVLNKNYQINGESLTVGASIGTLLVTPEFENVEAILKEADNLMYLAKQNNRKEP